MDLTLNHLAFGSMFSKSLLAEICPNEKTGDFRWSGGTLYRQLVYTLLPFIVATYANLVNTLVSVEGVISVHQISFKTYNCFLRAKQ